MTLQIKIEIKIKVKAGIKGEINIPTLNSRRTRVQGWGTRQRWKCNGHE